MVIDWKTWEDTYKPIRNPNSKDEGFWGCGFETFGEDIEYLKSLGLDNTHYWTLVDNNPNGRYLDVVSGLSG